MTYSVSWSVAASQLDCDPKAEIPPVVNQHWFLPRNWVEHRLWPTMGPCWHTSPDSRLWPVEPLDLRTSSCVQDIIRGRVSPYPGPLWPEISNGILVVISTVITRASPCLVLDRDKNPRGLNTNACVSRQWMLVEWMNNWGEHMASYQ